MKTNKTSGKPFTYALLDWYMYHVVIKKRHKEIHRNNFKQSYPVSQPHVFQT